VGEVVVGSLLAEYGVDASGEVEGPPEVGAAGSAGGGKGEEVIVGSAGAFDRFAPVGRWWLPGCVEGVGGLGAVGRVGIGTNSPGRHVWGIRRTEGSLRNKSAWPHARHTRVPRESSPRDRSESDPPPIVPVLSSFAQTKSDAPQFEQMGAMRLPSPKAGGPLEKRLALRGRVRGAGECRCRELRGGSERSADSNPGGQLGGLTS
jgi:hypothetical protein